MIGVAFCLVLARARRAGVVLAQFMGVAVSTERMMGRAGASGLAVIVHPSRHGIGPASGASSQQFREPMAPIIAVRAKNASSQ
jgi:hypothetical protein